MANAAFAKGETVKDGHNHTPEEEHRIREAALDETVAASFPASDPPSSLPNPDEHDADGGGVKPADESAAISSDTPNRSGRARRRR